MLASPEEDAQKKHGYQEADPEVEASEGSELRGGHGLHLRASSCSVNVVVLPEFEKVQDLPEVAEVVGIGVVQDIHEVAGIDIQRHLAVQEVLCGAALHQVGAQHLQICLQ